MNPPGPVHPKERWKDASKIKRPGYYWMRWWRMGNIGTLCGDMVRIHRKRVYQMGDRKGISLEEFNTEFLGPLKTPWGLGEIPPLSE